MRYGYFDNENKEYVIDKVNTKCPWTNYIGVKDMCAVLSQNAGGYVFYKTPQYHRITRFRANAPIDRPGHYVYIRDDDTGEFWSISWQPVGKDLNKAKYECRHGLSYSKYSCDYNGVKAEQTIFIPVDDPVELWNVILKNETDKTRNLSVFSYIEFSFHHIEMDNQNFQMSLYSAGSSYKDGVIEYELHYEQDGYQWFSCSEIPDGFDCLRDEFLGVYHDESNPQAVVDGACSNSYEKTGNHCAALHKKIKLEPNEQKRIVFMLGQGNAQVGLEKRKHYSDLQIVDSEFEKLKQFWSKKLNKLQIKTPHANMDTSINIWNLYQAEVNVMFSRFASFIEVGGRTGLGYRDTAQDAMTVPHSNPQKCRQRIIELLRGLTTSGYGLHLFDPQWFEPEQKKPAFKSPTVVPSPNKDDIVHGIDDVCSDDALWLIAAIDEYIKETGEFDLLEQKVTYADGGEGTVIEHMIKILDFSDKYVGQTGICKGLRADWNDCLNLGGGESAMVSFLHYWAIDHFIKICEYTKRGHLLPKYKAMAEKVKLACEKTLWDGDWYIRGITASGKKIGTKEDKEGKVHMESNTWAVFSGVADQERAIKAMDSVDEYLYTKYGLMLNAPSFVTINDELGFVTRVYPGVKENGSIFSHPNPWAWCAEAMLGRGDRAMKFYDALLPVNQNDIIEVREAEPYAYCQFIMGKDHTSFGRARHPFMTGSGGWAYFAATRYILGIQTDYDGLIIDPCIPTSWSGFEVTREFRGAKYNIVVENPRNVSKGVQSITVNGEKINGNKIPLMPRSTESFVVVSMK